MYTPRLSKIALPKLRKLRSSNSYLCAGSRPLFWNSIIEILGVYLLLILPILLLASCGFNPVYKTHDVAKYNEMPVSSEGNALSSIQIEPIASVAGSELYHDLSIYFPLKENPKYLLRVTLSYESRAQAIQKNSTIFREIIYQTTNYRLLDINTMQEVTSGSFVLSSSYNTSFSPYGSYTEHQQTNINLAHYTAEQIRQRLILYFSSNHFHEKGK
jgi:hypothetical protein